MNKGEFEDYHNLGSLTKRKGYGIGWAGIGAKLYIDRCQSIYTETRSTVFLGASEWSFPKPERAPVYRYVQPRGTLGGRRGTVVEIIITNKKDLSHIDADRAREIIMSNYNYAMKPLGPVVIKLNGERVIPFDPREGAVNSSEVSIKLKDGGTARGVFAVLKEVAPPGSALVSIVVHGKTVGEQYDFRQFARIRDVERVAGYVQCDDLIHVTTTSKDNFNRKTSAWREFDKKVGKIFAEWLRESGQLEREESSRELEDLAKVVQEDLNAVLRLPEIRALNLDLFQKLTRRDTALADPGGEAAGVVTDGQQAVKGTLGGEGEGGAAPVMGDQPGSGLDVSDQGEVRVRLRPRQLRSGIQIAFRERPDQHERAWPDSGLQAIVINNAHPAFKCAESLGEKMFYTIDSCLDVVCETIETESDREATLEKLFQGYLRVSSGE